MKSSILEKINKININPKRDRNHGLSVLWITATTDENRNTLTFRNHSHAFYEAHIIRDGEIIYGIGGKEIRVSRGNIILIEPKLVHRVIRHSENLFKVTVSFDVMNKEKFFGGKFNEGRLLIRMPSEIENSILFLAESGKSFGTYSDDIIESRLREIVYIIADAVSDSKAQSTDEYDGRIFRAKKYIEDNPSSFFTCGELAALCRLSEKQMARLFYKYEGKSMLTYIHEQKIDVAKARLTNSDETQESIALSLGFSSVHYFNKFFLKHAGVAPGEFRKSIKESHN
ncbi:MAG: helix-turn-helix transcriptional regulator [Clostridia bacterium]|nr:helix-turn-helix transcriptional regulator [Clostridia bacterium]